MENHTGYASFTEYDAYLFHAGAARELYRKLGAHPAIESGIEGTRFSVWAPNAAYVSVLTSRTGWGNERPMHRCETDGSLYECFLPGVTVGDAYRFVVVGADGLTRYKADPFAFRSEKRPGSASIVARPDSYFWHDNTYDPWKKRAEVLNKPMAVYELYPGSWKKKDRRHDPDGYFSFAELVDPLLEYVTWMGYTHVELIGVEEHPFDGSIGYQVTGPYAPTARYGMPDDLRYFIDRMHEAGVGVIMDWVGTHFSKDDFGPEYFDGTPLFGPPDPEKKPLTDWGTYVYDLEKPEVRSFLISNACYWINEFHFDALRVDAVKSILHPEIGSRETGRAFFKELNEAVLSSTSGYLVAEDASADGDLTKPVWEGGLGFTMKWNMGWTHDLTEYLKQDPVFRKYHHETLAKTAGYAFRENWVLPLGHDEVLRPHEPLVRKMPGSQEERLGTLKTVYTFQFTFPGKKLLFMGQDFAEETTWSFERELDWPLAEEFGHRDVLLTVKSLLSLYKQYTALYADSHDPSTFEWVVRDDDKRNVFGYIRKNPWNYDGALLVLLNFSPVAWQDYDAVVPVGGRYRRVFSTFDQLPGQGGPAELNYLPEQNTWREEPYGHSHHLTYSLRPFESAIFEIFA